MLKKYKFKNYDFKLIIYCALLTIVGIMAISSADASYTQKQIFGFVFGLVIMVFISILDYSVLLKFTWVYYVINLFLLLLVKLIGYDAGGATRWVTIAGIRFQPSETSKIILILFFSQFIMKYKDKIKKLYFVFICIFLLAPPLLLVLSQPDLSTSIMICLIFAVILFVGGIDWKLVMVVLGVSIPSAIFVIYSAIREDSFLQDYQQRRILAWLYPEDYANSEAYQTLNSMMAIGSGQLLGKGYNTNEISSVLNSGFISESQTDFIFTVVGEEFGFIGACIVVGLLLCIAIECLIAASKAKDLAGKLIATGMATWVGFQGFLNIGVATGVLPNTGIPLPFVSYGLTSLICIYGGMGFVMNVRLQCNKN